MPTNVFPRFADYVFLCTRSTDFEAEWRKGKYARNVIGSYCIYRVSIKYFPDYKHLLQENYVEYKHFFFTVT